MNTIKSLNTLKKAVELGFDIYEYDSFSTVLIQAEEFIRDNTSPKHTPGPWKIDSHAQIMAGESVLGRLYSGDVFPNENLPECTANGYLIAKAPELKEALTGAINMLIGTTWKDHPQVQHWKSLIKKDI